MVSVSLSSLMALSLRSMCKMNEFIPEVFLNHLAGRGRWATRTCNTTTRLNHAAALSCANLINI